MTYKHRDIVIAWMDGTTIQHKLRSGEWVDVSPFNSILSTNYTMFDENVEYRIKPAPVLIRHYVYQNALHAYPCVAVRNWNEAANIVSAGLAERRDIIWLDNWHEATFSKP